MCRIAAYRGAPLSLGHILFDAPHSLENQAYRPREMVHGTINVDGTGIAWWPDGDADPLRYVTSGPPWADPNLPDLAPRLQGRCVLATVRSATRGIPAGRGSALPFVRDGIAGSHNGFLRRFRERTAAEALAALPADLIGAVEAMSDSLVLFLLAVAARRDDPDRDLGRAAVAAVDRAARICATAGADCSLNLVLADGDSIAAVRCSRGVEPNSLYLHEGGEPWLGGAVAASEPLDDLAWHALPADCLLRIDEQGARVEPVSIVGG